MIVLCSKPFIISKKSREPHCVHSYLIKTCILNKNVIFIIITYIIGYIYLYRFLNFKRYMVFPRKTVHWQVCLLVYYTVSDSFVPIETVLVTVTYNYERWSSCSCTRPSTFYENTHIFSRDYVLNIIPKNKTMEEKSTSRSRYEEISPI